jgi:trigger factor
MSTDPRTATPEQRTPSEAAAPTGGGEADRREEGSTASADGSFRYRVERRKGSLATIEIEADAARLAAAADRVFGRRNREANIPGFRPGKAPRSIYERTYGSQHLWSEGAEDVIDETYREVAQAERLDPLDHPQLEITQLEPGKDLRFVLTVAVRPDVALGDYAAHGATVEPTAPTDEEVERVIAGMREHHAELRPVDRAAEGNDVLTVDIDVALAAAAKGDRREEQPEGDAPARRLTMARNGHLELGREYAVPGLAEGLRGVKAGEERTLELTFPDESDEDLRGKTGAFTVKVSSVAEKILPALDDGFAKTVGVADVAALRKAVRDELAHGAFHEARDAAADTAVAHAVATSEVEVPEVLVQDELDHMVAELKQRVAERGTTWERFLLQAKRTEGEIREQWREAAERRAKSLLVLDALARRENVSVSSTELAQEVALTPLAQQDAKALRSPQVLAALARSMRNRKVVDKLIGLDTPDAEREVLKRLGAEFDPHGEAAERAAGLSEEVAPAPAAGAATPSGIILPDRPAATTEGREAIRELLRKKD